jgi:uncharacterized membrane protein YeaQ/YmgE (transglycosylase-associated protein family)
MFSASACINVSLYKIDQLQRSLSRQNPNREETPYDKSWRERMFHIIWYVIIGLLSGFIAKSVMHEHLTMFWTLVLGVVGSILGGGLTHILSRSRNERYHPAGLIFSTLGAILVLFVCYKLKIHLP